MKIDTEANGGNKVKIGATRKELYGVIVLIGMAAKWYCETIG